MRLLQGLHSFLTLRKAGIGGCQSEVWRLLFGMLADRLLQKGYCPFVVFLIAKRGAQQARVKRRFPQGMALEKLNYSRWTTQLALGHGKHQTRFV